MFQHNVSQTMCRLAMWSVDLYGRLRASTDAMFHQVGSMEIAARPERWQELKRRVGQARSWGLDAELIGPAEVKRQIPIMRTDDLYGAFYVPSDCAVKAAVVAATLAQSATRRGFTFVPHAPVTGIEVVDGRVRAVETLQGRIRTDLVVCAAGIWGPLIGQMAGVRIPLSPVQHLFTRTGPVPELAGEAAEIRHPILRYQDKDLYFRQYGDCYGIGSYRHEPLLLDAEAIPRTDAPAMLPFTPEHFAESLDDAYDRIPSLRPAGLANPFNGLFSFTPDGFPILGEAAEVRGFWIAEALWITHAGGAGRAIAEWIVEGTPSLDLHECDATRFPPHATSRAYVRARAYRQYAEVYDIVHPQQQIEQPRRLRLSPLHSRLEALGAVFFEGAGWERPQWFESNERLFADAADAPWPARTGWTAQNWSPIAGAEHLATRSAVALFDLTPFTKIEVHGPGALAYLQRLCSNELDRPAGAVTYTPMLDHRGGLHCDLTVTRLAAGRFLVVTGAASGPRDLARLRRYLPEDGSVHLADVTAGYACIGVWGPRARELVQRIAEDDLSNEAFPYFTARHVVLGCVRALALRVSHAGELGWELYAPAGYGAALWDTLWEAGQDLGMVAAGGGRLRLVAPGEGLQAVWAGHPRRVQPV